MVTYQWQHQEYPVNHGLNNVHIVIPWTLRIQNWTMLRIIVEIHKTQENDLGVLQ